MNSSPATPSAPDPATLLALMPFATTLGLRLDSVSAGEVVGSLDWAEGLCTAGGMMHGGALLSLADSVAAACAYLNLPAGARTATISMSSNFFGAVRDHTVQAVSRPAHVGRTVIAVTTDLFSVRPDGERKPVAHVSQAQAVLL